MEQPITATPDSSTDQAHLVGRHGQRAPVDYELFLDCVHCGLCTSACPTYLELGTEMDSPRGRIYLMRAVGDGRLDVHDPQVRRHLELCLDCRGCESACPSGVRYGKLIEPFRAHMMKSVGPTRPLSFWEKLNLFHVTPYRRRLRLLLSAVGLFQRAGIERLLQKTGAERLLPASLRRMQQMLPPLPASSAELPEMLPAEGKCRARVALFLGCAADAIFPQTNLASALVLQRNGCEVYVPRLQGCCGALHEHLGFTEPAQRLARVNLTAFETTLTKTLRGCDAIVVNAAGCGAMLKSYGDLLAGSDSAAHFAAKVRDISEFLVDLGPLPPQHPLPIRAVYHDACHLCHAQQIRMQPRQLLQIIHGLEVVSLNESELCCGAAGSYNLTQPEMAERLGQRKIRNILETGAQAVFAGNVGCLLQIGRYLRATRPDIWVAHTIDAVWAAYSGIMPPQLTTR